MTYDGLELTYEVANLNAKSVRDDLECLNGYVALPALYLPYMRAVQAGAIGEDVLRPAAFRSKLAHAGTDLLLDILHHQ